MWPHTRTPALLAVLAGVCASVGCIAPYLNPYPAYPPYPPYAYPPPDKSAPPPVDNRTADTVTRAQYQPPPAPTPPQPVPAAPPQVLPLPRSLGGNPHDLSRPPATGEKLALAPNELPIEKALELTRRLDDLADENRRLQARIVTLEANGLTREQSLKEALREVKEAAETVARVRGDMQALRGELIALRERVKKAEDRELETLNSVIEALKQLLDDK